MLGGQPRRVARRLRHQRAPTALLVPVPDARAVVEAGSGRDVEAVTGLPPHVTILHPFFVAGAVDAGLTADLSELMSGREPFTFRLACVRRFPAGVMYLAPEPAEPFVLLTQAVWQRWPAHPPYRGAYDEIVPHLTVTESVEQPDLELRLAPLLPLETMATEVALARLGSNGRWDVMARFPLG